MAITSKSGAQLRVVMPFGGVHVGGSYISAMTLAQSLRELGVLVDIVLHQRGALSRLLDEWGIGYKVIRESSTQAGINVARYSTEALAWVRKYKPDIVHTHDAIMHLIWGTASKCHSIPQCWHQRMAMQGRRSRPFLYVLRPARIIAISDFVRRSLPGGFRENAVVMHNPVRITELSIPERELVRQRIVSRIGDTHHSRIVGFFGMLVERKRPEFVISLARRFSGTDVVFVLFGEDRMGLAERYHDSLPDNVFIYGFVDRAVDFMAACDAVIAPAREEPFGRTLIEANAVGVPVLASASGGHLEIIDDGVNGVLFGQYDVHRAATVLQEILDDEMLREGLVRGGRTRAADRWSPDVHAIQVLNEYRALVRNPS